MKLKILFICEGNSCYSQIAEGYGNKYLSEYCEVYSAGFGCRKIDPRTFTVMWEDGINISKQYSKSTDDFKDERFDIVVTFEDVSSYQFHQKKKPLATINKKVIYPDVAGNVENIILESFRNIRDEIKEFICINVTLTVKEIYKDCLLTAV